MRIFSDLSADHALALDHRILDFATTNPRLPNGAAVQVGNVSISELPNAVKNLDDPSVDIVILDSPLDATKYPAVMAEMGHAVNVCAGMQACPADVPAVVPSKLSGARAEAANRFVQYLTTRPAEANSPAPTPAPEPAPAQTQPAPQGSGH